MKNHYDLLYDGPRLQWPGHGIFRATSGGRRSQSADKQCDRETGPIPEGGYFLWLREDPSQPEPNDLCKLSPTWGLQTIPRGQAAGQCEPYWSAWGYNRIRLVPLDQKARLACSEPRDGFYIHDSTKGYTHGCIEVEPRFFQILRHVVSLAATSNAHDTKKLRLLVKYLPGQSTYGSTFRPSS